MKVTVYSTTSCPFCRVLRDYLYTKSIPYEDVILDQSPEKVDEIIEHSAHKGVPITVIQKDNGEKTTIIGFDREKLDQVFS